MRGGAALEGGAVKQAGADLQLFLHKPHSELGVAMLAVSQYAGGDDELQLALAVQAIAEAAQLGTGSAELLFPQTLDEYYAACEEEQPWKVAL